jgi:hypothetical protein
MPRAHLHRNAGQIWHLTHRCHRQAVLVALARGRYRRIDDEDAMAVSRELAAAYDRRFPSEIGSIGSETTGC